MIRNKTGKWIGICALVLSLLCCTGITAHADTIKFDNTVTRTGYLEDNVSKKAEKAGGAKYDNYFYATPTSFSPSGSVQLRSVQCDDTSLCTDFVTASKKNVTVKKNIRA